MSKIEWTEQTWNPIVGCSIVSPGCTNCYAMGMAARLEAMCEAGRYECNGYVVRGGHPLDHYLRTTKRVNGNAVWTGKVALAPEHILLKPLSWKKPRTIFVNSMGDLFHEDVPDAWIDRVFAVMALCPQHTFQVLTKRSARMRAYCNDPGVGRRIGLEVCDLSEHAPNIILIADQAHAPYAPPGTTILLGQWPLSNVWKMVSAERQPEADARIPDLLATTAAVRGVSAEPLLGPIDFLGIKSTACLATPGSCCRGTTQVDALRGIQYCERAGAYAFPDKTVSPRGLDWIIVGGESGHDARPMHPDWARSIRDQCAAAGVPFFFKQWGEWKASLDRDKDDPDWRADYSAFYAESSKSKWLNLEGGRGFHGERFHVMARTGKAHTGRLLDGREHNDMPQREEVAA